MDQLSPRMNRKLIFFLFSFAKETTNSVYVRNAPHGYHGFHANRCKMATHISAGVRLFIITFNANQVETSNCVFFT